MAVGCWLLQYVPCRFGYIGRLLSTIFPGKSIPQSQPSVVTENTDVVAKEKLEVIADTEEKVKEMDLK